MKQWHLIPIAITILTTVSACSSVATYQTDTSNLSQGVTALTAAGDQAGKAYASVLAQNASATWATQPVQLAISAQCDMAPDARPVDVTDKMPVQGSDKNPLAVSKKPLPPCQIIQSGATLAPPDALQVDIEKTKIYLAALQTYAAALVSIANTTDNDTLSKNVTSLNTSLTQIGTSVATTYPQEKIPEQIAVTGSGALDNLFTSYLNEARFQALRDGVHNSNQTVVQIAALIRPVFMQVTAKLVDRLAKQMSAMPIMVKGQAEKITGKDRTAAITAALSKASQINALLESNPADVAARLADAHTALDQALQGTKSETDVTQQMTAFLKAAQNAQTGFTQATTGLGQ